jgi:hypothetical protein
VSDTAQKKFPVKQYPSIQEYNGPFVKFLVKRLTFLY